MTFSIPRLLVLAPHTDDAELGCGATIARFLEDGAKVTVAAFSSAEESLPVGAAPGLLRDEFLAAMKSLGIGNHDARVFGYPVRRLSSFRQEVLEDLVRLRREVNPTLVLAPSGSDLHQDHQILHAESLRAFKDMSIWGYELPWNHIHFSTTAFVTLEERHVERKWKALQAYRSQFELKRPYFTREFIFGLAQMRGVQVKAPLAEAFDLMRMRL